MKKFWIALIVFGRLHEVTGQDTDSADSIQTREMEEIVIQSTRAWDKSPVSEITVQKEDIDHIYVGQDPSIVLERLTPSIVSYSDAGAAIGNYNQFRLRGIDQTRINMTLNGVPLNDMIDQGVFFSNFSDFANSMESIQVQRGVGTSTNGVASYAGSVNFESQRLNRADPSFELQLLGGSFDTYRVAGEVATGKMQNDLALYSRFTRTLSNGFKNNSGSDAYSFFFSGGYVGEKDVLKVTGFAGKTENDQSYLPVLRADIDNDPKTNYNHPNDTDDFEQELVQIQYSRILSSTTTFNSTLYYGGARGVFPFGLSDTTQLLFGIRNNHYGLYHDINYEKDRLKLSAGVHAYLFDRKNENSTAPNTSQPDYVDFTDKNEISLFTKTSYNFGKLELFGDIQMRYVALNFEAESLQALAGVSSAKRDWSFVNPKIGMTYSLNKTSEVYASFGRSGREPTRTDILQGDGSGIYDYNFTSVVDEDIVRAEYVNDFEIGYRYSGSYSSIGINYFHMSFEDEISLVGALAARSYVPLRQNVANSRRSGIELMGRHKISEKLNVGLTASYLSTNVQEFIDANGDALTDVEHIFAPDWIVNPEVTFLPFENFSWNVSGRYVSESFMELSNDEEFVLPDFFVLNTRFDYRFSEHFRLSFLINNLFDKLYFTEGSPVDIDFDGVVEGPGFRVQPPRNYYGMLVINF